MRWRVIVSDIVVALAVADVLWTSPTNPWIWLLVGIAFWGWRNSGSYYVWNKRWYDGP